jgi:signal transduction histidine kinase
LSESRSNYNTKLSDLEKDYRDALNDYYVKKSETALYKAYNLTRKAILSKITLLDLIIAYQKALSDIFSEIVEKKDMDEFVKEGLKFLSEALTPFEMTFRGYQEAIDQLSNKTSQLELEKTKIDHIVNKMSIGFMVLDFEGKIKIVNSKIQYYFDKFFDLELKIDSNIKDLPENVLSNIVKECFKSQIDLKTDVEIDKDFFLSVTSSRLFSKNGKKERFFLHTLEFQDISSFIQFDKMRNSFISMVSHELRNPITAISSSISQLQKYEGRLTQEEIEKLNSIILKNSELLLEIIDDLNLLSHIDEKKLSLDKSIFILNDSIIKVLNQLETKIVSKNIKIEMSGELNLSINADKGRIEQVIRIIMDNALKYSYENGKIEIVLETEENNNLVYTKILISDFGIGIREADLMNLFQRFYRSKDVNKIQGTGLGLSIAKEMIKLHNGTISVISKFGVGSTFKIVFPSTIPS